ncbi:MAG: hypothetical protein AAB265_07505, partial [candidate division NC10 bacterium]
HILAPSTSQRPRSLHVLGARRLDILGTRSLHVLTAGSLHVLGTRRLDTLGTRSLHVPTARGLDVLGLGTGKRPGRLDVLALGQLLLLLKHGLR